jgi:hypothetical protein
MVQLVLAGMVVGINVVIYQVIASRRRRRGDPVELV